MPKHYRDYTIGELLDAGFHADLFHFGDLSREEAEKMNNKYFEKSLEMKFRKLKKGTRNSLRAESEVDNFEVTYFVPKED